MRKLNTAILRMLLTLFVCGLLSGIPARAASLPRLDPTRGTELTVELAYEGLAIPDANFSLYRVGDIDADANLTLNAPFSRFDVSDPRTRSQWDDMAREMAVLCADRRIQPLSSGKTNAQGKVRFGSGAALGSGVYLVVGDEVYYQNVRYTTLPFLITLPNWNGETRSWDYAVTASPKLDRETNPAPTPTPIPKPPPIDEKLPQTGLLWWPVPPLLLLGVAMIVFGLLKTRKDRTSAKIGGGVIVGVGAVCFVSAMALFLHNMWDDARASVQVTQEKELLIAAVLPEGTDVPVEQKGMSLEGIRKGAAEITGKYSVDVEDAQTVTLLELNGVEYCALLSIPDLNLELPVRNEYVFDSLRASPCRYTGSIYTSDMVICAHNYTQHFGRLKDLSIDSEILLVDMDGFVFRYRVAEIETLPPEAVSEMIDSPYDLTLFTCTLGGESRVTVRCRRVSEGW